MPFTLLGKCSQHKSLIVYNPLCTCTWIANTKTFFFKEGGLSLSLSHTYTHTHTHTAHTHTYKHTQTHTLPACLPLSLSLFLSLCHPLPFTSLLLKSFDKLTFSKTGTAIAMRSQNRTDTSWSNADLTSSSPVGDWHSLTSRGRSVKCYTNISFLPASPSLSFRNGEHSTIYSLPVPFFFQWRSACRH